MLVSNPIWANNSYFKRNFMIFFISWNSSQLDWSSRGQILVRVYQMILYVESGSNEMEIGGWRMFWVRLTVDQLCQSYPNMDNFWILALKPSNWSIQQPIGTKLFISHDYQIFQIKNEYFGNLNAELKFIEYGKNALYIYRDYHIISLQGLLELTKKKKKTDP